MYSFCTQLMDFNHLKLKVEKNNLNMQLTNIYWDHFTFQWIVILFSESSDPHTPARQHSCVQGVEVKEHQLIVQAIPVFFFCNFIFSVTLTELLPL